jgi:hypothetical protein
MIIYNPEIHDVLVNGKLDALRQANAEYLAKFYEDFRAFIPQ